MLTKRGGKRKRSKRQHGLTSDMDEGEQDELPYIRQEMPGETKIVQYL